MSCKNQQLDICPVVDFVAGTFGVMPGVAPSHRLRAISARLRSRPRATVADLYANGRLLTEAKSLLPRGQFRAWTAAIGLPRWIVDESLRVFVVVRVSPGRLAKLRASCARVLTRKKVAASVDLTDRAVATPPGPDGLVSYRDMMSEVSEANPAAIHNLKGAGVRPEKTPEERKLAAAVAEHNEALGRRLVKLATDATVSSVHVSFIREPDATGDSSADDQPRVAVTVLGETETGGAFRRATNQPSVGGAFAHVTGEGSTRRCNKCKAGGLSEDAFNKGCHYCKKCDRERSRACSSKRRVANRAAKKRIKEMG